METLTSSMISTLIVDKNRDSRQFCSFQKHHHLLLHRPQLCFLPISQRCDNFGFLHLTSVQYKGTHSIICLSSKPQANIQNEEEEEENQESKTVHVKFQLQRECAFGDQFLIVGGDPIIGSWDPSNAIPLNWSDGHLWTAELDIPIGKSIQFKFIQKEETGNVVWQPGPDRIFQTYETTKTLAVCEDWDSAESQTVIEEDEIMVAENLIGSEELEGNLTEKPIMETRTEPIVGNVGLILENTISPNDGPVSAETESDKVPGEKLILENTISSNDGPVSAETESDKMPGEKLVAHSNQESISILDKDTENADGALGSDQMAAAILKKPASIEDEGNMIDYEENPILVPGLTPKPTVPKEEANQEVENSVCEAKDHNMSESEINKKNDHDVVNGEELTQKAADEPEEPRNELRQKSRLTDVEDQQSDFKPVNTRWGHKSLLKLFTNFGLF